jgi:hypothetical protein
MAGPVASSKNVTEDCAAVAWDRVGSICFIYCVSIVDSSPSASSVDDLLPAGVDLIPRECLSQNLLNQVRFQSETGLQEAVLPFGRARRQARSLLANRVQHIPAICFSARGAPSLLKCLATTGRVGHLVLNRSTTNVSSASWRRENFCFSHMSPIGPIRAHESSVFASASKLTLVGAL